MKKITAVFITLCMVFSLMLTVTASDDIGYVKPGEEIYIGIDEFTDSRYNSTPPYSLNTDNYALGFRFAASGAGLVSRVYIDDNSQCVIVELKGSSGLSKEKRLNGTITLKDKEKGGLRYTYEFIATVDSMGVSNMEDYGVDTYSLPYDYQTSITRFRDSSDENSSQKVYRFVGEFGDDAYFSAKILDQSNLYLGYEKKDNTDLMKKYPEATLRFVKWYDSPKFNIAGDLTIKSRSSEYVYRVMSDGSLQKFGTYSSDNRGYTGKTDTLGSYVISDRPLNAAAAPTAPTEQPNDGVSKNPNTGK